MGRLIRWLKWQIPGRWQGVKRRLYEKGYRPKPGTLFYSPSLHWLHSFPTPLKEDRDG